MKRVRPFVPAAKWVLGGVSVAAAAYGAYVGLARSGQGKARGHKFDDELLAGFMPVSDVVERHRIQVSAPVGVTLTAACEMSLAAMPGALTGVRSKNNVVGSERVPVQRPEKLLEQLKSCGWVVLAEIPDREIVLGAVIRPWEPNPLFRAIPSNKFTKFNGRGYIKIVFSLRADATRADRCVVVAETRALAMDEESRAKFRRYWAFLSPGIILIRRLILPMVKAEAERRWRSMAA